MSFERWYAQPPRAKVPPFMIPWLTDSSSLSARIRNRCGRFGVRVLRQTPALPLPDEAALLDLRPGRLAWVREVLLLADDVPVVFGRSILPHDRKRGPWRLFHGIGSQPLASMLFVDPAIERGMLTSFCFDARDSRYRLAVAGAALTSPPSRLWARRSLFHLQGKVLMVSETFLPAIAALPTQVR